jgi:CRISPR-associated protein Csx10
MTQKRLEVEISLQSSLMIGTDGESTLYNQTRDYIPGAALRGALAETMLSAEAGDNFEALFGELATEPIFDNLYPSRSGSQTYPLPLSARTCKYYPGFQSQEGEHHGVGDILVRQAVFEAMLDDRVNLPCLYKPLCPECHSDVKGLGGYYEVVARQYGRAAAPVRRISRTAIDRWRQTAAERLLYTLETVEPGTQGQPPLLFRGAVLCGEDQGVVLERWLPQVKGIGGGRSRGLGNVEVQVLSERNGSLPGLRERLEEFDAAVRAEWRFYQRVARVEPLADDVRFFSLDLLAPAFLTHYSLPATRPALADLRLPVESMQLWRAISQQSVIGGWHMGGRLPRRTALATAMGSVFMYRTEGLSFDDLETGLQKLENEGLGEERARGFGQVLISSPIHYQPEVTL